MGGFLGTYGAMCAPFFLKKNKPLKLTLRDLMIIRWCIACVWHFIHFYLFGILRLTYEKLVWYLPPPGPLAPQAIGPSP